MFRRAIDIAVAGVGLAASGPMLLALAAAVRLTSPGPALFVQTRVGRGRRPIRVFKLRTMVAGERTGIEVTAASDPRITPLGALLRKTKLDELPQLWNVLRGDMTIVGPRPEVPRYVERYRPEWAKLLTVRPGITDLASLTFRDEESLLALANDREHAYTQVVMPLKLGLALEGLERGGFRHDLGVIARTALAVLHRNPEHPVFAEARRKIEQLNRSGDQ
jgi:lipopolysaccharide/colanic/teichoic acid biosynthesis glycosyltransferase